MVELRFTRSDCSYPLVSFHLSKEEAYEEMRKDYHHYAIDGNIWDENESDFIESGDINETSAVIKYADGLVYKWEIREIAL